MLGFSNVYLVSEKLDLVSASEVDRAEERLGVTFPAGYREYVTQLGVGMFCDYMYVFPPQKIVEEASVYRDVLKSYSDLWSRGDAAIKKEELEDLIVFAQTVDMGKVAFHPMHGDQILLIPYNDDVIQSTGPNLSSEPKWLYEFGIWDRSDFVWFNSEVNQGWVHMIGDKETGLLDRFSIFVHKLSSKVHVRAIGKEMWFFLRSINGYVVVNDTSLYSTTTHVSCHFDKDDDSNSVNTIIGFFEASGFSIKARGDKKK